MLGFITSLRHPHNSSDYGRVLQLLTESLASWKGQVHPGWFGIVVGNGRLDFRLPNGVTFLPVDFPAPSAMTGPQTGRDAVLVDKGSKLAYGLARARQLRPDMTHFMFVDADDSVSNRLAGYVAANPAHPGWYFGQGYRYDARRRAVRPVEDHPFHLTCGSSHIVRADLYPAPTLREGASREQVMEAYGPEVVKSWFGSHLSIGDAPADRGEELQPLPFPGALYRVGTGENHSGSRMTGRAYPVTSSLAVEFGIPATGWSPLRRITAFVTPSAAVSHGRYLVARARRR